VAARYEPRSILAVALAGGLASVLMVLVAPGALWALWAGAICAGLALAAVFPTTLSLAARHMPVRGSVNGWFFAGASLGGMVLPWVIGQLFESVGPRVTFLLVAADLVASLGVLAAIVGYLRVRRFLGGAGSPAAERRI
jgi:fucose permease